jgi:hypothetical protein
LLLNYLIKSYDLLLNLLLLNRQAQPLLNLRILGLTLEEDGDMDLTVEDIVVVGEVTMVVVIDTGVDIMVIMEIMEVLMVVLMQVLMLVLTVMDQKVLLVLQEATVVLMPVLMVAEEENGDIMQRNLKNKRCV